MTPAELDALLRTLPRAAPAQLKRLHKQLVRAVHEPWFDHKWFTAAQRACASRGLEVPAWQPRELDVGEAWLPLYEGLLGAGSVARLTACREAVGDSALWSGGAQSEARRALQGLVAALAVSKRCLPAPIHHFRWSVETSSVAAPIAGSSLGAAVCVSAVSAALGKPGRSDVAASATVRADGTLGPVEFLEPKVQALRTHQPGVQHLIVARSQPAATRAHAAQSADGIALVPCDHVLECLEHFELTPSHLPQADLNQFRRHVARFGFDDDDTIAVEKWRELTDDAFSAYQVLSQAGHSYTSEATRALAWWTLFSSHAGQAADLGAFHTKLANLDASVSPESAALLAVFAAAQEIDVDPERAVASSRAALQSIERLARGRERLLGRALGTHGRALMHAAEPGEAVGFLERAVGEHRRHEHEEVPRSLAYLATALRLAGDPTAAFAAVERALSELEGAARYNWAQKTRAYLELERGRCLLSLGRPRPALAAFEWAADACEFDHEHPRSAALRGLASAHRLLGNAQSSEEYFERCCGVAMERGLPLVLRQVAAMAIADLWLANARITSQLRDLWLALFPGRDTPELVAETRQAWIY